MRFKLQIGLVLLLACGMAGAQGPPPVEPEQPEATAASGGTPPVAPVSRAQQMKSLIKQQVSHAVAGNYPDLAEWKPLTAREKFHVFFHSTYLARTFATPAIDEMTH